MPLPQPTVPGIVAVSRLSQRLAQLLATTLLTACAAPEPPERPFATFDAEAPSWTVDGDLVANIEPIEGRTALHVRATASGTVRAPEEAVPTDWSTATALTLRVRRDPAVAVHAPPASIEVRIGSERAWFSRRVQLAHVGWAEITLPLAWFRPRGKGPIPRWDEVTHLVIGFDGAEDLWLDDLALVPGTSPHPAVAGPDDMVGLGFPTAGLRVHRSPAVDIVTDAPDLDLDALAAHLTKVERAVRADLPFLPDAVAPPLLVVASSREVQLGLIDRIAGAVGAELGAPPATGFTLLGIATATWDPAYGSLRPVYTHEYVHSLLNRVRALPDDPHDWLNEGLASHYQVRFHPGSTTKDLALAPDLAAIFDGGAVTNRGGGYARAEATVDLLLHDARYAGAMAALFPAFAATGSSALRPHLRTVLGVDEPRFVADWVLWVESR